jgi:hypothetical protein
MRMRPSDAAERVGYATVAGSIRTKTVVQLALVGILSSSRTTAAAPRGELLRRPFAPQQALPPQLLNKRISVYADRQKVANAAPAGQREFRFHLKQTAEGWSIGLEVYEKSDNQSQGRWQSAFAPIEVAVKSENFAKMERTARVGFDDPQAEFILTTIAPCFDRVRSGRDQESKLKKRIEEVVEKRSSP